MKVGYFGIPGSFTYIATSRVFENADLVGAATFKDVFQLLIDGTVENIVVPIENTLAGSIYDNYDLLDRHELFVVRETYLRIEHSLLSSGDDIEAIRTVYSHQKALEQCSKFFDTHPDVKPVIYSDTASAARFAASEKDPTVAAIASRENAEIYGLTILQDNLENNASNFTRFLIIGRKAQTGNGSQDKCSLIVTLPHKQGSLYKLFGVLSKEECNVMKIESRPFIDKPFEYIFYLDFLFDKHRDVQPMIDKIDKVTASLKVLGTYEDTRPW
jgi:prephenate dehydratase